MNKQCICFKERMSEYIDNVMNEQEKRKFKEHMNICADCSEELNQMQHIVNILKELPEEDLPENFHKDLMSRIYMIKAQEANSEKTKMNIRKLLRYVAPVASAACVVLAILFTKNIARPDIINKAEIQLAEHDGNKLLRENFSAQENQENAALFMAEADTNINTDTNQDKIQSTVPDEDANLTMSIMAAPVQQNEILSLYDLLVGEICNTVKFNTYHTVTINKRNLFNKILLKIAKGSPNYEEFIQELQNRGINVEYKEEKNNYDIALQGDNATVYIKIKDFKQNGELYMKMDVSLDVSLNEETYELEFTFTQDENGNWS